MRAIHLLLCGGSFELTQKHSRVTERTLELWISRFNSSGIDGLTYRPITGRPRVVAKQTVTEIILPVVDEPSLADQTHWTVTKLVGWLEAEKDLKIAYSTLVRYLHEHDYKLKTPRPVPEPSDANAWEEQREAFAGKLLEMIEDESCDLFFGDEAGFEGDPRPRRKWAKRGERITQGYFGRHVRQNVIGAVAPKSGKLVSLIVPHCNSDVFQVFLDTMAEEVADVPGRRCRLVLDNAGWHKVKSLNWHHIEPVYLPPYSPDFNPIERLWQHLKSHHLAGFITKSGEALADKLIESIQSVMRTPKLIRSVCNTHRQ